MKRRLSTAILFGASLFIVLLELPTAAANTLYGYTGSLAAYADTLIGVADTPPNVQIPPSPPDNYGSYVNQAHALCTFVDCVGFSEAVALTQLNIGPESILANISTGASRVSFLPEPVSVGSISINFYVATPTLWRVSASGAGNYQLSFAGTSIFSTESPGSRFSSTSFLALQPGAYTLFMEGAPFHSTAGVIEPGQLSFSLDQITDPAAMLAVLLAEVVGIGPGTSLADKVQVAQTYFAASNIAAACGTMSAFVKEVDAQSGKKLTTEESYELASHADAVMVAMACN